MLRLFDVQTSQLVPNDICKICFWKDDISQLWFPRVYYRRYSCLSLIRRAEEFLIVWSM